MYGEKAKELRKAAGLSQKDCEKITNHSQSMISGYEKSVYPNAEYIAKLCIYLKKPLHEFWTLDEDSTVTKLPSYIKPEQAEVLKIINTKFDIEARIAIWELFQKALESFAVAGGIELD